MFLSFKGPRKRECTLNIGWNLMKMLCHGGTWFGKFPKSFGETVLGIIFCYLYGPLLFLSKILPIIYLKWFFIFGSSFIIC